jgi:hypothetical protein
MIYHDNQTPLTDFQDDDESALREVNQLRDLTVMLLGRCASQRRMIHTAYELPDKLDALTELLTTTAALAAIAVATDLSSQQVYEAVKRLVHHK